MWRRLQEQDEIVDVGPSLAITIPVGINPQFRSVSHEPLTAVGTTVPPSSGLGSNYLTDQENVGLALCRLKLGPGTAVGAIQA
jgi:mannose-6-phosphate isomerase-like protein (cupin superfamily)